MPDALLDSGTGTEACGGEASPIVGHGCRVLLGAVSRPQEGPDDGSLELSGQAIHVHQIVQTPATVDYFPPSADLAESGPPIRAAAPLVVAMDGQQDVVQAECVEPIVQDESGRLSSVTLPQYPSTSSRRWRSRTWRCARRCRRA